MKNIHVHVHFISYCNMLVMRINFGELLHCRDGNPYSPQHTINLLTCRQSNLFYSMKPHIQLHFYMSVQEAVVSSMFITYFICAVS